MAKRKVKGTLNKTKHKTLRHRRKPTETVLSFKRISEYNITSVGNIIKKRSRGGPRKTWQDD